MILHIDGDGFYSNCECLFRPDLENKPICVLSQNDAIIVAVNKECKALGYKRGDAFIRVRNSLEAQGVEIFSANIPLYNDISARLNILYSRYAVDLEIYSIDEAFLYFPNWINANYTKLGMEIRNAAATEIGISVSVGIAQTKTLAKMCNKLAKQKSGVCEWEHLNQDQTLKDYPIGEIWGIGEKKAAILNDQGLYTAYELKNYPGYKARQYLTITGWRIVQELNGIPAIEKQTVKPRQQIICSHSFRCVVFTLDDLIKAIIRHAEKAARQLRAENSLCKFLTVYLTTNPYAPGRQYANQASCDLPSPTDYLPEITSNAIYLLRSIYRPGFRYHKSMLVLSDLSQEINNTPCFPSAANKNYKYRENRFMNTFDAINRRYGTGAIRIASGLTAAFSADEKGAPYEPCREYLSPSYTTNINELPVVR